MRLSPVGGNFCCAKNMNFKARFFDNSLEKKFGEKVSQFGSKDTVINISDLKEGFYEYPDCYDDFGFEMFNNTCPAYTRNVTYTNKAIPGVSHTIEYIYPTYNKTSLSDLEADTKEEVAEGITKSNVENGEKELLIKYADKTISEQTRKGAELNSNTFKKFIADIKKSDINKNAIDTFIKYIKALSQKAKLNQIIKELKTSHI